MREERWLNGWVRHFKEVLTGTVLRCAGCGRSKGIICVVVPDGYEFPEKDPDWPFEEKDCPVCK